MSDTEAMRVAAEVVRAVVGPNGHLAPQGEKSADGSLVSTAPQGVTAPGPQGPGDVEETARHEGPAPGETAPLKVAVPVGAVPRDSEFELKLLVDADRLAGFNDAPIIATNARNNGTRRHFRAVYYDTPGWTLRRNGLSLRVRQSGARFVQTVKAEAGDDPLRRGEWEASVPSIAPDIALAMPFIPAKIRSDLERQELEAVFSSDIHRHQRLIDLPSGSVEVAFDRGLLKAGGRSTAVSEIELELKGGSTNAIYELALRLAEHGPVRPSIYSKSARGFDLAADKPPAARKPRKLRLDPSISLDDAFATILRSCLRHLLQSLPAAEDGRNPEGIHQLRVSLRRLRSALHLMRSAGVSSRLGFLRSEAGWLAQDLAAAREWDIFQGETLPAVAKGCSSIAGFDALEDVAERHQSAAHQKARLALIDRRCACFVIGLGGWVETRGWRSDVAPECLGQLAEPANNFAQRILSDQYAKVLKRGRNLKSLTVEDRHRLRLAVKKLRYVADFLLPLYGQGKSARRFYDRVADLQEELGCYNDMATTTSLLREFGAESYEVGIAVAAIAGWQAHAMVGAEPRVRGAWRDFAKTKTLWSR
jgi:triphosphatase